MTKFIRLVVYSYLTLDETVTKAARLCRQERAELRDSEIARAKKDFDLKLKRFIRPGNLLERGRLDDLYSRIETRVLLTNTLSITIESDLANYEHENLGEFLAYLIRKMPERLSDRKITIDARSLAQ